MKPHFSRLDPQLVVRNPNSPHLSWPILQSQLFLGWMFILVGNHPPTFPSIPLPPGGLAIPLQQFNFQWWYMVNPSDAKKTKNLQVFWLGSIPVSHASSKVEQLLRYCFRDHLLKLRSYRGQERGVTNCQMGTSPSHIGTVLCTELLHMRATRIR